MSVVPHPTSCYRVQLGQLRVSTRRRHKLTQAEVGTRAA